MMLPIQIKQLNSDCVFYIYGAIVKKKYTLALHVEGITK